MPTLSQSQSPESWSVFVGRILILAVYLTLFLFFSKGYSKSKRNGLPNKFLLGYAVFFGFLTFYGVMGIVDQSLIVFTDFGGIISKLDVTFAELYGITPGYQLVFTKLANPLYLLGLLILMLLLAAQVYPLEMVLNWRRAPATVFLFAVAAAILPAYHPSLCYTVYMDVVTGLVIGGMLLGLILNIGINCKLAASTTGDLKKRSLSIIFASILFYVGFLMSLRIQDISIMFQVSEGAIKLDYDVVLGYVIQSISALLYWRGLRSG
ncbi:MAG: hypothetical protein JW839_22670 [Candidatus Lokiarchaeota archaeon]|nr:hypothetical protein [Candidatus Lokiarchaeota archaeon]